MKKLTLIASLLVALLGCIPAKTQAQTNQPPTTLWSELVSIFDVNNTNGLISAKELNLTPYAKWDPTKEVAGGGLKVDWWVTDQQGAFMKYEELADEERSSALSIGYQARTVFGPAEIALGLGAKNNIDDSLGTVEMFLTPQVTYRIFKRGGFDMRLTLGADIRTEGRPEPFLGLVFRSVR